MTLTTTPIGGRPHGEVRQAIVAAIQQQGPMALRELASASQVGYRDAKRTLTRCVQAGQLVVVGKEKREHSKNWVSVYDVAPPPEPEVEARHGHGWVDLGRIVAGWAR